MNLVNHMKKFKYIILIFFLIITFFIVNDFQRRKLFLPNLDLHLAYPRIDVQKFNNQNKNILLINKNTSFIKDVINFISTSAIINDNATTIIIIKAKYGLLYDDFQNIKILTVNRIDSISNLFNLDSNKNWFLSYDKNNFLHGSFEINGKFYRNIIQKFSAEHSFHLDNSFTELVNSMFKIKNNGHYLLVNKFKPDCVCYEENMRLEQLLKNKNERLKIILIGDWKPNEINNIKLEKSELSDVNYDTDITNELKLKKYPLNDIYINTIIIKNSDSIKIFPLYDYKTLIAWRNFLKTM